MTSIRIAHSALSGRVYAGRLNANGNTWKPGKTDVTSDFLCCVLDMLKANNGAITIESTDGGSAVVRLIDPQPVSKP
jgi:hypothetical protein